MSWRNIFECRWDFQHIRNGKIIFEFKDRKNILVDEGEKAMVDVFFRKRESVYFAADLFYIGLYKGTIVEGSTLATLPNEPDLLYGYSRLSVARSTIGFPTLEQDDDGNWRVISQEVTFTASGGDIGPINGAFLATSSDDTGALVGAVAAGVERTIVAGDQSKLALKFKQK
jgi:hypothetical protein